VRDFLNGADARRVAKAQPWQSSARSIRSAIAAEFKRRSAASIFRAAPEMPAGISRSLFSRVQARGRQRGRGRLARPRALDQFRERASEDRSEL
jgi:hypothetical protein